MPLPSTSSLASLPKFAVLAALGLCLPACGARAGDEGGGSASGESGEASGEGESGETGETGETGESGESGESGETGEDPGICEDTKPGTPTSFDIDVSQWPVEFDAYGPTAQQILTCTLAGQSAGGPNGELGFSFACDDGTNTGTVDLSITGLEVGADLASDATSFELELFTGGETGGDESKQPRELGGVYDEFILRDEAGLVFGGFGRSSSFRDVWAPLSLGHASLCNLVEQEPFDVPHREGGLRVHGEAPSDDLVLRAGEADTWTADDGSSYMVHAGKADTWGCCHGGFSNDGLIIRLPPG